MTPEQLAAWTKEIESMRERYLFDEGKEAMGPVSETHFLAALAQLDAAQRSMALAHIFLMRGD